jgi:hypothetical protein
LPLISNATSELVYRSGPSRPVSTMSGPGLPGATNSVLSLGSMLTPDHTAAPPWCQEVPGQVSRLSVDQSHSCLPSLVLNAVTLPSVP